VVDIQFDLSQNCRNSVRYIAKLSIFSSAYRKTVDIQFDLTQSCRYSVPSIAKLSIFCSIYRKTCVAFTLSLPMQQQNCGHEWSMVHHLCLQMKNILSLLRCFCSIFIGRVNTTYEDGTDRVFRNVGT